MSDLNEGKPPISVKFEIPYFTTSGIQVRIHSVYLFFHFTLLDTPYFEGGWGQIIRKKLAFFLSGGGKRERVK